MEALLEVDRVIKRFGGVTAVSAVSLSLEAGHIYGLIGPTARARPPSSTASRGWRRSTGGNPVQGAAHRRPQAHQVFHQGIGRTFQVIRVFPELTALENLLVVTTNDYAAARARAEELLGFVKLTGWPANSRAISPTGSRSWWSSFVCS